jgi:hypothetical protein
MPEPRLVSVLARRFPGGPEQRRGGLIGPTAIRTSIVLQTASIKRMIAQPVADDDGGVKGWKGGPREPSLIERASNAASEILGEVYGRLIYGLLEGARRGHISPYSMRLLLERALPAERPTPVTLPLIDCAADLLEADRRLMAAANVGAISHSEWRKGQECIEASWRIRQQARLEEP